MEDNRFVDIHTHILPGIDDGAESLDIAFDMLNKEYQEGVRDIVLTPHFGAYNPDFDLNKAEEAFQNLRSKAVEKLPGLKLYPGNEILYSPGTVVTLKEGKAKSLAGTDYVLVEFLYQEEYATILKAVKQLTMAGYRPVIAHVERYDCLLKDLDKVEELIDQGAYVQVNGNSFLRGMLDKRFRFVKKLLKYDLIHLVATDCHNMKGRRPEIKAISEKICQLAGETQMKQLLCTNGHNLLKNKEI